jgi:hypothetical protein
VKPIELFLKYPNLFFSQLARKNRTIHIVNSEVLGRVFEPHETNHTQVDGIFLSWGIPGDASRGYYYSSRRDAADGCNRKISNFQQFGTGNNSYSFKISNQKTIKLGKSAWNYNNDNSANFARLVGFDEANIAWLSGIPELKESFRLFASETTNWWYEHRNPNVRNTAPQRLVDVTEFISDKTAKAACEQLDKLIDKDKLTHSTWELQTHKLAGLLDRPHIYRARREGDPEITNAFSTEWTIEQTSNPTTIRSWNEKKNKKGTTNNGVGLGNEPLAVRIVDDFVRKPFDVHIEAGNLDSFDVRFHAHYTWISGKFNTDAKLSSRMNQYTRKTQKIVESTKKNTFLPIITGIVMELCPKTKTGSQYYHWTEQQWSDDMILSVMPEESNPYKAEELLRVQDQTKKRAIKGAYKGGYQGISSLTYNGMTLLNYVRESGLSAIAKGSPVSSYNLDRPKRMPLSLEDFKKIERPKVDIKPIEIGHLRFYRLSVPPKRHITADILSDLLLPSMPELLIATDAHVRITQADNFVSGEHCSGGCSKNLTLDCELPPGLYLVNRHEKCALGHDPGRAEYTSGFGDTSNETITIRRLLSQMKVSYDQFRANMVSNNQTEALHAMSADDNSAFFGRL